MAAFVGGFQVLQAEVKVDGRGFEFDVAQHELDVAEVTAVLQQGRGERVPEEMAASRFARGGLLTEVVNVAGQLLRIFLSS